MREKLVDALLELASDEFVCANDAIALAKETEEQLLERLINVAEWYRDQYNEL